VRRDRGPSMVRTLRYRPLLPRAPRPAAVRPPVTRLLPGDRPGAACSPVLAAAETATPVRRRPVRPSRSVFLVLGPGRRVGPRWADANRDPGCPVPRVPAAVAAVAIRPPPPRPRCADRPPGEAGGPTLAAQVLVLRLAPPSGRRGPGGRDEDRRSKVPDSNARRTSTSARSFSVAPRPRQAGGPTNRIDADRQERRPARVFHSTRTSVWLSARLAASAVGGERWVVSRPAVFSRTLSKTHHGCRRASSRGWSAGR